MLYDRSRYGCSHSWNSSKPVCIWTGVGGQVSVKSLWCMTVWSWNILTLYLGKRSRTCWNAGAKKTTLTWVRSGGSLTALVPVDIQEQCVRFGGLHDPTAHHGLQKPAVAVGHWSAHAAGYSPAAVLRGRCVGNLSYTGLNMGSIVNYLSVIYNNFCNYFF